MLPPSRASTLATDPPRLSKKRTRAGALLLGCRIDELAAERKAIAAAFGIDEQILRNWLHALTYLRNLCAHHARVWNRQMVIKPIIAKKHLSFLKSNDRFYAFAVVIHELMLRIAPLSHWHERLVRLLKEHPFIDSRALGFAPSWNEEPFWKPSSNSSAPSPATS